MDFYGTFKSQPEKTDSHEFCFISDQFFKEILQKSYSITKYEKKFQATIPNALMFGNGAVVSPDGLLLARDVTPDFGVDSTSHWIVKRGDMWRRPRKLDGKILVGIHNVSQTYYHWLLEEIPRILFSFNTDFDIGLVSNTSKAQKDVVSLFSQRLGSKKTFMSPKGYEVFQCQELIVPSLPDRCKGELFFDENRPSADTVSTLREFAFSAPSFRRSKIKQKIFISRKHAKSRRLSNENQITSQLLVKGFQVYELEEMGFLQQVELFHNAECIVSVHGSALANIVFCQSGTRLIEIFHTSYIKPMYAFIAMHLKLDYRPIVSNIPIVDNCCVKENIFSVQPGEILSQI